MPIHIAVGAQWGDEGKGRVVDLLAAEADIVARYNGGDNAGHTVTVDRQTFKLHLIPSGIIHPHTLCVLGNGMVVNPATFQTEIAALAEGGIDVSPGRLAVSHAAHLITPAHRMIDRAQDEARGSHAIGTTGRGIGPAYTDKATRRGLRAGEILDLPAFKERVYAHLREADCQLQALFGKTPADIESLATEFIEQAQKLAPYVRDTSVLLRSELGKGKHLLAEGAQGTLLDIDYGSYPFVTSSTTTATGVFSGLGLGLQPVERVIGIVKAFQTRVGSGGFPTELFGDMALRLRGTGANPWDEFGATTGRPRRVGWLDGVLLRYAAFLNGLTELTITKLDILSGLPSVKICVAYRRDGKDYSEPPTDWGAAEFGYEPVYEELPGWQENVGAARSLDDLPAAARRYLARVEAIAGVPIKLVSVGPERQQVIFSGESPRQFAGGDCR